MTTLNWLATASLAATLCPALYAEAYCPGNVASIRPRFVERSIVLVPVMLNGCGDVAAALFLARLLRGESLSDALALTAAAMYAVIETTVALDRHELALVAAQNELASPSRVFPARQL